MVDQPLDKPSHSDDPLTEPQPTHIPVVDSVIAKPSSGLAIAALVTGVTAFLVGWIPFVGLILGITAVVLGIVALNKMPRKGMSIAGIVTGGLAVLFNLIIIFAFLAGLALFGGVAQQAGRDYSNYTAEQQAKLAAKKDFAKGDTAAFDNFEVKVNSLQRGYLPAEPAAAASAGKELVVVNLTVKNVSQGDASIAPYELKLNADSIILVPNYLVVAPSFSGGGLPKGAEFTGNLVYEVTKGANNLKLQYLVPYYDSPSAKVKTLTYSLQM